MKELDDAKLELRLAEISSLIEKEEDPAKLSELTQELRQGLVEKGTRVGIRRQEARSLLEESGKRVNMEVNPTAPNVPKLSKRDSMSLVLGLTARSKKVSDEQKRSLDVSLTSTASTFVEATSEVNGVNNAGVFIDTKVLLDLLVEEKKISGIQEDVIFSAIKGLVTYPYRASRTAAKPKNEGGGTGQQNVEYRKLDLVKGWLQIEVAVTDEVLALSDIDLGTYLLTNILNDLVEDWATELVYGAGVDDVNGKAHIKGITVGATAAVGGGYESGKVLEAVIAGVKLVKGKYRRGAKIYVSQSVFDNIAFATDDNGNFKFPVLQTLGLTSLAGLQVKLDESLNDGDFVIGNVARFFKANLLKQLTIEADKDINTHISKYVASQFLATAPVPGAFVYGFAK